MNFLNRFPLSLWTIICIALGFFGGTTINVTIVPPASTPYMAPPGAIHSLDEIYQLDPQLILPHEPVRQNPLNARQVGEPFILSVPPADLEGGKPIILTVPIEHLVGI